MKQNLIIQEESLAGLIDTVKNLIAQLDEKINCAVKKTAEPQVHSVQFSMVSEPSGPAVLKLQPDSIYDLRFLKNNLPQAQ